MQRDDVVSSQGIAKAERTIKGKWSVRNPTKGENLNKIEKKESRIEGQSHGVAQRTWFTLQVEIKKKQNNL